MITLKKKEESEKENPQSKLNNNKTVCLFAEGFDSEQLIKDYVSVFEEVVARLVNNFRVTARALGVLRIDAGKIRRL